MAESVEDSSTEAFIRLLSEGHENANARQDALVAMQSRQVWLATWEPRARGYRTLINSSGDEALAVFSSEQELRNAASRFGWLEPDGSIAMHSAVGSEVTRHAWTREYPFMVLDIAANHSVEFARDELRDCVELDEVTGQYHSSPPSERPRKRQSSGGEIQEIGGRTTRVGQAGTYGAARAIPPKQNAPSHAVQIEFETKAAPLDDPVVEIDVNDPLLRTEAPAARSNAPTVVEKISVPPRSASVPPTNEYGSVATDPLVVGSSSADEYGSVATDPPGVGSADEYGSVATDPPTVGFGSALIEADAPGTQAASEAPQSPTRASIARADTTLVEISLPPDDDALTALASVLRAYPEVEWAAYCEVAQVDDSTSPAIGLRVNASYRENVRELAEKLAETGYERGMDFDVLLIDDKELLRAAKSTGIVFFPWQRKRTQPPTG